VNEFDDLGKKAKAYAEEHPEEADKAVSETAGIAGTRQNRVWFRAERYACCCQGIEPVCRPAIIG
jgi:hypothetical protein